MASGSNILSEYLVKLGYVEDRVAFAKFAASLRDAEKLVDRESLSMIKSVAGFQAALVGGFAAVGGAVLGTADKVAQADQEYRLLGMRMYTTQKTARELKIALDALGQPLENVMWDPELARRFNQLIKDQRALTEELGPNFENQMIKIRDVRFEFSRFGVELEYLTMKVVEDLAEAFGTNIDGILEKLRGLNDWFIANMPAIAQWFAGELKPILIDVKEVMLSVVETVRSLGPAFSALHEAFTAITGDNSIIDWFAKIAIGIDNVIQIVAHSITALGFLAHGKVDAALAESKKIESLLTPANVLGTAGALAFGVPGAAAGAYIGTQIDRVLGTGTTPQEDIQRVIAHNAAAFNVPPELALAVAQVESNFRQYDKNGNVLVNRGAHGESHATGIFQLEPGTAKGLGVDPNDINQNILGGLRYLSQLLARSGGNQELALEQYYGSKDPARNRAYADRVMTVESGVHIDHLTINVPPSNLTKESVHDSVRRALDDFSKNRTQRNIAEFSQPGWSYP